MTDTDNIAGYKIGRRVRLVRNAGIYDGASGTVMDLDYTHGWRVWVHPDYGYSIVALRMDPDDLEHIDPADATPAPLDPSKVHAGDTVTVHVEYTDTRSALPFTVTAEVTEDSRRRRWVGPAVLDGETGYTTTLTAHQPAPEPEPATSEIGDAIRELKHVVRTEDGIEGMALQVDDLWNRVQQHPVIDPVDARAKVAEILRARMGGATEAWFDYADAVLSALGIEAAR